MAQIGSALPWGGRGRGFKSRHSDHEKRNALSETKSVAFFIIGLKRRLEAAVQCPVTPTMKKSDYALFSHCRAFLYVNCQMTFAHY